MLHLLWRDGRPNLSNNRYMAGCRLENLTCKLQKMGMVDKYSDRITKLLQKGNNEGVHFDVLALNDGSARYLPHHAVTSADKPNKVCGVFDCATKQLDKRLNKQRFQGPDLNNKLISFLLRLRQYQYLNDRRWSQIFAGMYSTSRQEYVAFCGCLMACSLSSGWCHCTYAVSGVSSGWSSVWHRSNTGLSSTQYEQIPINLGVWPFRLTPFFFWSTTFW